MDRRQFWCSWRRFCGVSIDQLSVRRSLGDSTAEIVSSHRPSVSRARPFPRTRNALLPLLSQQICKTTRVNRNASAQQTAFVLCWQSLFDILWLFTSSRARRFAVPSGWTTSSAACRLCHCRLDSSSTFGEPMRCLQTWRYRKASRVSHFETGAQSLPYTWFTYRHINFFLV